MCSLSLHLMPNTRNQSAVAIIRTTLTCIRRAASNHGQSA
jgi:hypothetical protein